MSYFGAADAGPRAAAGTAARSVTATRTASVRRPDIGRLLHRERARVLQDVEPALVVDRVDDPVRPPVGGRRGSPVRLEVTEVGDLALRRDPPEPRAVLV